MDIAVLLGLAVAAVGAYLLGAWVVTSLNQRTPNSEATIRSEDFDVIVEAGRYKGRCLIPGCGWFTANWTLDRSAEERIKLHLREHATGEPMPPLSTMNELS